MQYSRASCSAEICLAHTSLLAACWCADCHSFKAFPHSLLSTCWSADCHSFRALCPYFVSPDRHPFPTILASNFCDPKGYDSTPTAPASRSSAPKPPICPATFPMRNSANAALPAAPCDSAAAPCDSAVFRPQLIRSPLVLHASIVEAHAPSMLCIWLSSCGMHHRSLISSWNSGLAQSSKLQVDTACTQSMPMNDPPRNEQGGSCSQTRSSGDTTTSSERRFVANGVLARHWCRKAQSFAWAGSLVSLRQRITSTQARTGRQ
jgi:hypothetical protein